MNTLEEAHIAFDAGNDTLPKKFMTSLTAS